MPDVAPSLEIQNQDGDTIHENGSAVLGAASVPAVGTLAIAKVLINVFNDPINAETDVLSVSFDGGTDFFQLAAGSTLEWTVHGAVTQLEIKSNNAGGVSYEILMNRENC